MGKPCETLAGAWAMFAAELPINSSPAIKKAMQRAFYAGAGSFLAIVVDGFNRGIATTEADIKRVHALSGEIERFITDIEQSGKGTANATTT